MQVRIEEREGVVILHVEGKLDAASTPEFERQARATLAGGDKELMVDARGLEFISSSGLRALLTLAREQRRRRKNLRIENTSTDIFNTLQISGFASMLDIRRE